MEDFAIDERARDEIVAKLDSAEPATVAGIAVTGKDRMDGWRFSTDAGWLLFRMSGTEPLLRIYTEVREERLVDAFISEGRTIAGVA